VAGQFPHPLRPSGKGHGLERQYRYLVAARRRRRNASAFSEGRLLPGGSCRCESVATRSTKTPVVYVLPVLRLQTHSYPVLGQHPILLGSVGETFRHRILLMRAPVSEEVPFCGIAPWCHTEPIALRRSC